MTLQGVSIPAYKPATNIPNWRGKVFPVTGASSRVGYETEAELVRHGAKVYLGARSEIRDIGAISKLKAGRYLDGPGDEEVLWFELNLSTPERATHVTEEFMDREIRLEVLIKNAAMHVREASILRLHSQFATKHITNHSEVTLPRVPSNLWRT
ncbi:hypothetical protein FRB98_004682 [Tulasnella sp. 332]|nr:hypothetical protein FRB98_004682 [Tulasnella sp. 332]